MPTPGGTSIYLPPAHAARIRDIAARERRQIVDVFERMVDLYEPLTLSDHAILHIVAEELHLTTGQALSHILHDWYESGKEAIKLSVKGDGQDAAIVADDQRARYSWES